MARIARRFFQSKKKAQQSYLKRIQDPSKKRPALVIIDGPGIPPPPPPPEPSKLGFAAKINHKSCLIKSKKRNLISKQGLKPGKSSVFPSMPGSSSLQPPTKKHMKGV